MLSPLDIRAFQVLMKDVVTPAPPEEVCKVVKKCLEGAALVNYTKISDYAQVEGEQGCSFISYLS